MSEPGPMPPASRRPRVTFREAVAVWCRVAALSFGGPAGQIAVMQRILVDEKRWVSQERFLHALNYCMLLPGPEAQQLATYNGWLLHRTAGGLVAGLLFVLPGFLSVLALSVLYAGFRQTAAVEALFYGLKPAVLAVVVEALVRIGRRALGSRTRLAIAAAAFVAIFYLDLAFPLIIVLAALTGYLRGRWGPARSVDPPEDAPADEASQAEGGGTAAETGPPALGRTFRVVAVWLAVWWAPVFALWAIAGGGSIWVQEGLFFSKTAVVTFGGAYAVLAYIAQRAVEDFGWLAPGEMLDGLGMAETTPGPLIQVVQFVAFMGAYRNPGPLDPLVAGIAGSVVTTWVTFAPCFLWIFAGAPYIEWLRGRKALGDAMSAITPAVVGVILNLAVWFALHVIFGEVVERPAGPGHLWVPVWSTLDPAALVIAAGAFVALLRLKLAMIPTLLGAALLGALLRALLGV